VAAAVIAVCPAGASAATAPSSAPQLTTEPYAFPATFRWTPATDVLNTSQAVYGSSGVCTAPVAVGGPIVSNLDNSVSTFTVSPATDGIFCFYIKVTDLAGTTADSPGVTVAIDRADPAATVVVSGQTSGLVAGTVSVSGTSADAVSGVASSILHIGAIGACPAGLVVGPTWDTFAYANGAYDVCNVVTDNAGHSTTATVTITVANILAPAAVVPSAPVGAKRDKVSPLAPTKLAVVLPRSRRVWLRTHLRLRWVNPSAPDLDRVVVVLNAKRPPRSPADGSVLYRGLGTSMTLKLRAGRKVNLAMFAYDHSGNVSRAARRVISLASLLPLSGSELDTVPRLTWKAKAGVVYYNVQIFRNGKRVLVGWPAHAFYRFPSGRLASGTYVWFVWPAFKRAHAAPRFGDRIGRATFVYAP
jgi:hypothetical protein